MAAPSPQELVSAHGAPLDHQGRCRQGQGGCAEEIYRDEVPHGLRGQGELSGPGLGVCWAGQLPCVREGAVDSFSFDILSEN